MLIMETKFECWTISLRVTVSLNLIHNSKIIHNSSKKSVNILNLAIYLQEMHRLVYQTYRWKIVPLLFFLKT